MDLPFLHGVIQTREIVLVDKLEGEGEGEGEVLLKPMVQEEEEEPETPVEESMLLEEEDKGWEE
eukprot:9702034-Ditylum_brightwellii.AAC.1